MGYETGAKRKNLEYQGKVGIYEKNGDILLIDGTYMDGACDMIGKLHGQNMFTAS